MRTLADLKEALKPGHDAGWAFATERIRVLAGEDARLKNRIAQAYTDKGRRAPHRRRTRSA